MAEVDLATYLSYQALLTTSESKLVYLLAEVRPGAEIGYGPAALNLAIVLDKSGSMYAAEKLEYVIEAVSHVIDKLRPSDLCAVIAFADKARVLIPSSQIYDKESARRMVRNIDQIDVGSGTEMLHGINAAVDEVRKNFSRERMNHIILLTDGLTLHENRCKEKCVLAAEEGISVSTIGVGDDFNEKFLLDIANSCRGTSYYIDVPRDVPVIFDRELRGVQSIVVRNPELQLKLSRDVSVRRAFKVKPLINDLGSLPTVDRVARVRLTDLQKDETQSLLFELVLPSRKAGTYRVAQAQVVYDVPGRPQSSTVTRDITITYTDNQAQASIVNPRVMQVVDAVSVFRQQTRALELAQAGDRARATQLLRSAATQLLEQGQKELADQALAEANRIERGYGATSAGTKKLEYGTRKLTQLLDQLPPLEAGNGQPSGS
ncbi:MAG TPA: VWA domain-containing protein [Candidatus Nitrosotenuis sp.]|nr:VWA domain-containing protein [Candidatus Nitrosotenuis sp.]